MPNRAPEDLGCLAFCRIVLVLLNEIELNTLAHCAGLAAAPSGWLILHARVLAATFHIGLQLFVCNGDHTNRSLV